MRSLLFLAPMIVTPVAAWAEDFTFPLPVVSAEVFPFGALTQLEARLDVPAGEHRLMTLVPEALLGQGRPVLSGEAALLSVKAGANTRFDPALFDVGAVAEARRSLEAAEAEEALARAAFDAANAELDILTAQETFLKSISGGDALASAETLLAVVATLGDELARIEAQRRAIEARQNTLEEALIAARESVSRAAEALEILSPATESWQLLTLEIVAQEAGEVIVSMPAFSNAAGWSIAYEARLDEAEGAIRLARNVTVSQSGPLPWIDASLKLSTADPFSALQATGVGRSIARIFENVAVPMSLAAPAMREAAVAMDAAKVDADGAVVRYDIPGLVTLPSGAEAAQIALSPIDLPAETYLLASPRFDETAFVSADFTNISGEPILPGEALLYRDQTLIGNGALPLIPAGGEDTLGFGPERAITLEVEFIDQQAGDRGIIRGQETREDTIRLTARNLGSSPKAVRLRYAVPTSQQEDLSVRVALAPEPDTRDVEGLLGVMEWRLSLDPEETALIELGFDLRWPEGMGLDWRP
ncbi:MAG: DUF4139 domain-containing protein [Pseudomonadota bacterium]